MGQTVVEKVAAAHASAGRGDRPYRAGDFVTVRPTRIMTHDNTAPAMAKFLRMGAMKVRNSDQAVIVLDHDIQNRTPENLDKYERIRAFAERQGIDFYPGGSGIGHQIMVEAFYVTPGSLVVASDSHANMYGALGAIGTPVVRTDAAAIWATGEFWWRIPRTVECRLEGALPAGSSGKDVILSLCSLYSHGEVLDAAVEFRGSGAASLSIDDRLTIANMTTEWGARCGWFEADDRTLGWLRNREEHLDEKGRRRFAAAAWTDWKAQPIRPDPGAVYAATIEFDLGKVQPHVSGPDSVHRSQSLRSIESQQVQIQKAYLVSCVNAREVDLATAAKVLRGRRVADGVEFYVAAASREVESASRRSGAWQTLLDAGARPLPAGCGPCIGLGAGLLRPGETGISATNRNFKGRMGSPDARCFLASPAVVAASAAAGYICGPKGVRAAPPDLEQPAIRVHPTRVDESETVAKLAQFPDRLNGRAVFVPGDHLNTDGIYGREFTYRDDLEPEQMAAVIFRNHDPQLAERLRFGDVIVGGYNFGCGSSREQAVTALQYAGIAAIVAGSFSTVYLRNAYNCGFLCLEAAQVTDWMQRRIPTGSAEEEEHVTIDFSRSTVSFGSENFPFRMPEALIQQLILSGGLENRIREQLDRARSEENS